MKMATFPFINSRASHCHHNGQRARAIAGVITTKRIRQYIGFVDIFIVCHVLQQTIYTDTNTIWSLGNILSKLTILFEGHLYAMKCAILVTNGSSKLVL